MLDTKEMIYTFKTSVRTKRQVRKLKPLINHILPNGKWNFDLEDCDKVLRVDSDENVVVKVIDVLSTNKFHCEELV